MIKKNIKIISIVLIMLLIILTCTTVFALNPDDYAPTDTGDTGKFTTKAAVILRAVQITGLIVAVLMLAIMAIKYIFASVEGKAKYKAILIPYIVGCLLLGGTAGILGIIADVADTQEIVTPTPSGNPMDDLYSGATTVGQLSDSALRNVYNQMGISSIIRNKMAQNPSLPVRQVASQLTGLERQVYDECNRRNLLKSNGYEI